jgi:prevent-host-death family protein
MVQMGVRDLKDNLSAALRQAAAGQVIEVTEHGHPLARIVPIHRRGGYVQLLAEGRVTLPEAGIDLLDYEPPPLVPGERLGSDILAELRADER